MRELLNAESVDRGLRRVAGEILERHEHVTDLVLVGVRRGGVPLAEMIRRWLERLDGAAPPLGTVDITLYRDDAATAMPNPRIGPSMIPVTLEQKTVILVDDVLYTGRTIRAALDALLDYGRPKQIELAILGRSRRSRAAHSTRLRRSYGRNRPERASRCAHER